MNIVQPRANTIKILQHTASEWYDPNQLFVAPASNSKSHELVSNNHKAQHEKGANKELTANGSACSQLTPAPHEFGRTFSGRLSGTATNMKNTSKTAIAVAKATINVSL